MVNPEGYKPRTRCYEGTLHAVFLSRVSLDGQLIERYVPLCRTRSCRVWHYGLLADCRDPHADAVADTQQYLTEIHLEYMSGVTVPVERKPK